MASGFNPSCKPEEIVKDLKQNRFMIMTIDIFKKEITRNNRVVIMKIIKRPLPLFMLVFE